MDKAKLDRFESAMVKAVREALHPKEHYLIVPDEADRSTWEFCVYDELGNLSPKLMREAAETLVPISAHESGLRKADIDRQARERLQGMYDEIGEESPVSLKESGAGDFWAWLRRVAGQGHPNHYV